MHHLYVLTEATMGFAFKESCCFVGLNSLHVKFICYYIIHYLFVLISKSFNIGIFHTVLKIARVLLILKGCLC